MIHQSMPAQGIGHKAAAVINALEALKTTRQDPRELALKIIFYRSFLFLRPYTL